MIKTIVTGIAALFVLASPLNLQAQKISIRIDAAGNKAFLFRVEGEKTFEIDTLNADEKGIFNFNGNNYDLTTGIHRLAISGGRHLDFIYDGNDISLRTKPNSLIDSMKVITSESNELFYKFKRMNRSFKEKRELIWLVLTNYPEDDSYYDVTKARLKKLQKNYLDFVQKESQKNPDKFTARYIRSARLPVIDLNTSPENRVEYLKVNGLDHVDFNDTELIYSDLFTNKVIEYLTYYRDPGLSKSQLEDKFKNAVDSIVSKAKVNLLVYEHIVEYLINGFSRFGFEEVIDYIVGNYVINDDLCIEGRNQGVIDRRIEQVKHFREGEIVPNICLPDTSGKMIELYEIPARTLIVFYQSTCPHCEELMPRLDKFYEQNKKRDFEILAVSIDTDESLWDDFVETNDLSYVNVFESESWEGKVSRKYHIYATPTMFLVDEKNSLIAMPKNFNEVKRLLN